MTYQCANCDTNFASSYCPACGQKCGTARITMHNIAHELWHGFTHTDKGIVRLCIDLLLRPATAYQHYFKGRRKSYFSPVVFFLLSFALYIYLDEQVFNYEDYIVQKRTGHLFNNEIGRFEQKNAKYIALTILPVQALLSYLFFRKRYNLAECITFWLFCVAFANSLMIVTTPLRILLIDQKATVDYALSSIVLIVYLWHLLAVFGAGMWNKLKCIALVLMVSVTKIYVSFFFLSMIAPEYYPDLVTALKIIFVNKQPMFMNGKWITPQ